MNRFTKVVIQSLIIVSAISAAPGIGAADLASGEAKGSYAPEGAAAATITHADAFVDQKDERRPTILVLTDKKLPTEKWKSEFDLMLAHEKFSGVLFWLDKDGAVFRTDTYENGRQSSVAGLFDLKLDNKGGKEITGTAVSKQGASEKLDVTFHATVK
jgi:hypothetical protein